MPHDKNYYQILNINQDATQTDVKKAYRKMALQNHPDRNPGDPSAEERFKLISEAYAVLIDPGKRSEYDLSLRAKTGRGTGLDSGFAYRQEDIFRDFFESAYARQAFNDLNREFQRSGVRFDENFLNNLFFGGRGFVIKGFVFTWPGGRRVTFGDRGAFKTGSPYRSRSRQAGVKDRVPATAASTPWKSLGRAVKEKTENIAGWLKSLTKTVDSATDIFYNLTVSRAQADSGDRIELKYDRDGKSQKVLVGIPPGTKDGARLRLKSMGHSRPSGPNGDLFLNIRVGP